MRLPCGTKWTNPCVWGELDSVDLSIVIGFTLMILALVTPFVVAALWSAFARRRAKAAARFNALPWPDKCKRRRADGPTPCLLCIDYCKGKRP